MKLLFLLILLSTQAFALEAVITVLEAPVFNKPSLDADVVQYYRRGAVIKIHPSVDNNHQFDHMGPEVDAPINFSDDPFLKDIKPVKASMDDEFIPIVDRRGRTAYILSSQIYVYFNSPKEFSHSVNPIDETEYRLKEPLPKNYPLKNVNGLRGYFTVGVMQPYEESYPYLSDTKLKGYSSPIDVNIAFMKKFKDDNQDRFFWGGIFNVRLYENSFSFVNSNSAVEKGLRFGLGPQISYDAYKGEKNRLAVYGNVSINPYNQISITQRSGTATDYRYYRTINFTPRLGFQYHRKGIFPEIDFIAGTGMEIEPPTTFSAKNGASQENFWKHTGNDSFTTRFVFTISGYIGIQSAY